MDGLVETPRLLAEVSPAALVAALPLVEPPQTFGVKALLAKATEAALVQMALVRIRLAAAAAALVVSVVMRQRQLEEKARMAAPVNNPRSQVSPHSGQVVVVVAKMVAALSVR